jgi:hypothetical protein
LERINKLKNKNKEKNEENVKRLQFNEQQTKTELITQSKKGQSLCEERINGTHIRKTRKRYKREKQKKKTYIECS